MREAIDTRHGVILYLEDVSVSFSGYRALDNLNLAIDAVPGKPNWSAA